MAGFILLVLGSGPLLVTLLAAILGITPNSNPNPVIFGIMTNFSFWPGLMMMGIGVYNEIKLLFAIDSLIAATAQVHVRFGS